MPHTLSKYIAARLGKRTALRSCDIPHRMWLSFMFRRNLRLELAATCDEGERQCARDNLPPVGLKNNDCTLHRTPY